MKDEAAAKSGTTLEVLAPYLPYGIEVETGINDGERERTYLHSLTQDGYPRVRTFGHEEAASFEDMLPVLRSFSALCDTLPNGTIPAVEVAKLVLELNEEHCEDGYLDGLKAIIDIDGWLGDCVVTDENQNVLLSIYSDWLIGADDTLIPIEAYDYLRSCHFALPVNGRPLLEGIDYLVKEAGK